MRRQVAARPGGEANGSPSDRREPYDRNERRHVVAVPLATRGAVRAVGSCRRARSLGPADRDFAFPKNATPSLVLSTQKKNLSANPAAEVGMAVITVPEIRWHRRDIKTVGLLPASMAKQAALDAGVSDAWFVENGFVNEGTSNNAFIVTVDGTIVTRHLGTEILHGITRKSVMALVAQENLKIAERPFTAQEAYEAREAFVTSASAFVMPVTKIDGHILGNGVPGPVAEKLRKLYIAMAKAG